MNVGIVRIEDDERASTLRSIDLDEANGAGTKRKEKTRVTFLTCLLTEAERVSTSNEAAAVLSRFVRIMRESSQKTKRINPPQTSNLSAMDGGSQGTGSSSAEEAWIVSSRVLKKDREMRRRNLQ